MNNFVATFGSGQLGGFGSHYYVLIEAPDEMMARRMLNKAFEGKWASIYSCEKFEEYVRKYGSINQLGRLQYTHHSDEINEVYYENYLI